MQPVEAIMLWNAVCRTLARLLCLETLQVGGIRSPFISHLQPHTALGESSSSGVPPIRLVNGSTPLEGRVEIKLKGQWGTMCGKRADVFTAKVICRQLGYFGNAEVLEYAYFGQGSGPVWLQPFCRGDELSVDECPNFGWNKTVRCGEGSHQFDLAVVCGGK